MPLGIPYGSSQQFGIRLYARCGLSAAHRHLEQQADQREEAPAGSRGVDDEQPGGDVRHLTPKFVFVGPALELRPQHRH